MAEPQNDVAPLNLEVEVGGQNLRAPKLSIAP